ncbi:MAG: oligosaccharide flippase family protein [Bacteroidales bacterium]|nr:oligosaccharide flippase family protein [Acholeplasmataceae bacterium]MCK9448813.1 oligosaccharide flippase family protein [Bacteroidales bacterium]
MIKQFIKDAGIYGITGILSKGIAIFLVPVYTKILTPNDYGIIDLVAVIYSIVAISVPLEISQAVARFLADDRDNPSYIKQVSSIGLFITLIAFSIFFLVGFMFKEKLTLWIFEDGNLEKTFVIALLHMFFTGLFYFVQNQLKWTLKPLKYSITSIVYIIVNFTFSILFVVILKVGLIGVFYAYLIAGTTGFLLGFYFSNENYSFSIHFPTTKKMLAFSLPLVPSGVSVFFINTGQRIMIKGLMELSDLGLFAVARKIASILGIGFQSIQNSIIPLVYQNMDKSKTPKDMATIFRFMVFFLLLFFVLISLFSKELLIVMTTPAYYNAYKIIPLLVLAECFVGLQRTFSVGLSIAKKTKILAYINILGSIVSLIISFVFIYYFGIMGAAIAYLIQSIVITIIQITFSQKFFFVQYPIKSSFFTMLFSIVIITIGLFFIADLQIVFQVLIKLLLLTFFILASIKYSHLINPNEIGLIFSKIKTGLRGKDDQ